MKRTDQLIESLLGEMSSADALHEVEKARGALHQIEQELARVEKKIQTPGEPMSFYRLGDIVGNLSKAAAMLRVV